MPGGSLTKLGAVLVVAGALLMAGPIFGFSTLAADRGVNVGTAATESALLAIEETGETPDNQNDAVVLNITNNANERFDPLDAQAEIVEDTKGALAISSTFDSVLDPGATTGLELTCSGGGDGKATIEVTADATGSSLSIQGVTYSYTFDYSCTGGGGGGTGPAAFEATDISTDDPTQTFTVNADGLGNKDELRIDLSELSSSGLIDYSNVTDADVTVVSGDYHSYRFEESTNEIVYQAQGSPTGTIEIELTNFQILDSGSAIVSYSDDAGRTDSDNVEVGG